MARRVWLPRPGERRPFDDVPPHIASAASEAALCLSGNDMAHGDFVDPVMREDAEEVLELMAEVLSEVYQLPARLARRRAASQGAEQPAP